MADAADSKSVGRKPVKVRLLSPAPPTRSKIRSPYPLRCHSDRSVPHPLSGNRAFTISGRDAKSKNPSALFSNIRSGLARSNVSGMPTFSCFPGECQSYNALPQQSWEAKAYAQMCVARRAPRGHFIGRFLDWTSSSVWTGVRFRRSHIRNVEDGPDQIRE